MAATDSSRRTRWLDADVPDKPVRLRDRLKALAADLESGTEALCEHLEEHRCLGKCGEARQLAQVASDAQYQLGMTRFLNEDDDG